MKRLSGLCGLVTLLLLNMWITQVLSEGSYIQMTTGGFGSYTLQLSCLQFVVDGANFIVGTDSRCQAQFGNSDADNLGSWYYDVNGLPSGSSNTIQGGGSPQIWCSQDFSCLVPGNNIALTHSLVIDNEYENVGYLSCVNSSNGGSATRIGASQGDYTCSTSYNSANPAGFGVGITYSFVSSCGVNNQSPPYTNCPASATPTKSVTPSTLPSAFPCGAVHIPGYGTPTCLQNGTFTLAETVVVSENSSFPLGTTVLNIDALHVAETGSINLTIDSTDNYGKIAVTRECFIPNGILNLHLNYNPTNGGEFILFTWNPELCLNTSTRRESGSFVLNLITPSSSQSSQGCTTKPDVSALASSGSFGVLLTITQEGAGCGVGDGGSGNMARRNLIIGLVVGLVGGFALIVALVILTVIIVAIIMKKTSDKTADRHINL